MKKFFVFFTISILFILCINIGFPEKRIENNIYSYKNESDVYIEKYVVVPIVGITKDNEKEGVLGNLKIGIIDDNNNIDSNIDNSLKLKKLNNNQKNNNEKLIFDEKTKLDENTIKSILEAISFVENNYNTRKNYFISYEINTNFVSGTSSGASFALGLISLFENKSLKKDILITGSIDNQGNLLPSGGIFQKIKAAEAYNFSVLFIPKGQGKMLIKEKELSNEEVSNEIKKELYKKENKIDERENKIKIVFKEKPINTKINLVEVDNIKAIDLNLIFTS